MSEAALSPPPEAVSHAAAPSSPAARSPRLAMAERIAGIDRPRR